jgi:hypothetical protein
VGIAIIIWIVSLEKQGEYQKTYEVTSKPRQFSLRSKVKAKGVAGPDGDGGAARRGVREKVPVSKAGPQGASLSLLPSLPLPSSPSSSPCHHQQRRNGG